MPLATALGEADASASASAAAASRRRSSVVRRLPLVLVGVGVFFTDVGDIGAGAASSSSSSVSHCPSLFPKRRRGTSLGLVWPLVARRRLRIVATIKLLRYSNVFEPFSSGFVFHRFKIDARYIVFRGFP